jgi:hypothetical protein
VEAPCPEIEVLKNLTQGRSTSMTDKAISPLRRRMIEDMAIFALEENLRLKANWELASKRR